MVTLRCVFFPFLMEGRGWEGLLTLAKGEGCMIGGFMESLA